VDYTEFNTRTVELGGLDWIQYKHCWIRWIRL